MNEDNMPSSVEPGPEPAAEHPAVHHIPAPMHDLFTARGPEPVIKEEKPVAANSNDTPMAIVKMYSTRGVEYAMMSIALWLLAGSMITAIINLANGETSMSTLATPLSLMLVCFPIFAVLFLRLKKAEKLDPSVKRDPSRRRFIQITQLVAFISLLVNTVVFVYEVLNKLSDSAGQSIGKSLINLAIVTAVAGPIFAYYWREEHRLGK